MTNLNDLRVGILRIRRSRQIGRLIEQDGDRRETARMFPARRRRRSLKIDPAPQLDRAHRPVDDPGPQQVHMVAAPALYRCATAACRSVDARNKATPRSPSARPADQSHSAAR
jgi:hypothetical protein